MANTINVNQNNNDVSLQDNNRRIIITDNNAGTTINVTQPVTSIVTISALGPQGAQGPAGETPDTGSFVLTSSFNAFTASYYVDSASFEAQILANSSSISLLSGSFETTSGSFSTRITNLENFSSSLDATFATDAELNAATASLSASIANLSSSFETFSGSYNTGSFSGSFTGDGAGLYNIPASGIVGLNLSQISSGSVSASISPNGGLQINTNVNAPSFTGSFTGSFAGDGSQLTGIVSSKWTGSNPISRDSNVEITGSLKVKTGVIELNTATGQLIRSGIDLVNWPSGTLNDFSGNTSINWGTRETLDYSGIISIDWGSRGAWDSSNTASIDWDTRQLIKSDGSTITVDWENGIFTGSLHGTASWAENAISSSYALSSSYAVSSSYSTTSSYAIYAETASFSDRTTQIDVYVLNQSGQNIAKGVVVRITGSNNSSDIPRIVTASYENDNNSANTLGITTTAIANGAEGYVITEGILKGINTQAFTSGQLVYLGATGSIIGTAPVAPLHAVRLGEVIRHQSNNGSIYVRIDNGYEIGELHDVKDTSTTSSYGDLLVKSGSVWINSKQLTGSYGLTGSLDATQITASNLYAGTAYISGSLTVFGPSTFYGTASFVNITASNLFISESFISVNVFEPVERFGGLKVYDSGSSSATASLAWDSLHNHWVYQNVSGSTYTGGMLLSGPRNTGSLGDEPNLTKWFIPRSDGGDHLDNSQIFTSASITQVTGSLTVTAGITGSLFGNSSTSTSASFASTASYVNPLIQGVLITGSLLLTGSASSTLLRVGTNDLVITGSRIGIGTTTPVDAVEIVGYSKQLVINGTTTTDRSAWIGNDGAGTGTIGLFNGTNTNTVFITGNGSSFLNGGNVGIGIAQSSISASLHISGTNAATLLRLDAPGSSSILHVTGSGRVGIGTSTPNATLDVSGSAIISGSATWVLPGNSGGYITPGTDGISIGNNTSGVHIRIRNSNRTNFDQTCGFGNPTSFGMTTNERITILTSAATSGSTGIWIGSSANSNIFKVQGDSKVAINKALATASLDVAGTTVLSGSFNTATSGSILTVIGSGSTQPVFTVQGSQGELFSVTDSLTGSLFSVNDISGLPILEVFSDNTTLIGNYLDPMLITTAKVTQTNSGSFTVYSLPTASYDTAFFEYSVKSGSNARAGTIMAIQSGSSVNFTETTTLDFGSTTAVSFTVIVTGSNMALTGSSTSGAWTIKAIVRGL